MRLAVISDVHDSTEHAGRLREAGADALVVCGDLTTFGALDRAQAVADALRVDGAPLYFVTGNCDAVAPDCALRGCHNLHGRFVELGGWFLSGVSGSLPCPSHTPGEHGEDDYSRWLAALAEACAGREERLILVSHQPPFGTDADRLATGRHVGCRALRAFIDAVQPAYCLTGHIHEAASRSRVGRTVVLNPGPFARGNLAWLEL